MLFLLYQRSLSRFKIKLAINVEGNFIFRIFLYCFTVFIHFVQLFFIAQINVRYIGIVWRFDNRNIHEIIIILRKLCLKPSKMKRKCY